MKISIFKITTLLSVFILAGYLFVSCSDDATDTDTDNEDINTEVEIIDTDFVATDWTDATHSKNVDPNYDEVFSDTEVKRLDFVISENNWEAMMADMTSLYGTFGGTNTGGPGGGGPGGGGTTTFQMKIPFLCLVRFIITENNGIK